MGKAKRQTVQANMGPPIPLCDTPEVELPQVEEFTVAIEAPMYACDEGYAATRLEVYSLIPSQAAALKRLRCSLAESSARTKMRGAIHPDGKVVDSNADVIRWLLDQFANNYPAENGSITNGMKF